MLWQRTEDCDVLECGDGSDSMCWPSQQCADHQGRLGTLHTAFWFAHSSLSRPLIGQNLTLRSHLDTGHWACGLVLTAARNATLYRDIFISNNPWWHSPNIGNIANIVIEPRVSLTLGLESISHHSSAGSGFIGQARSPLTDTSFCSPLCSRIIRSIKMFKARSKARDRVWLKWSVLRQLTQKPHLTSSSPSLFGHDTFFHLYQTKISK